MLIQPLAASFPPHSLLLLVHERHGALRLATEDPREELQCQAHVDGHKDVWGVDHHGDGGEKDGVENGLFPGLQDVDAGDEQVLVVQPGQVLLQVLEVHPAGWMEEKWRWWGDVKFKLYEKEMVEGGCDNEVREEERLQEFEFFPPQGEKKSNANPALKLVL